MPEIRRSARLLGFASGGGRVGWGMVLAAAVVVVPGGAPAGACACGIAIEATVSDEQALVIEGDGTEEIVLSLDLVSDGPEPPAVILPVPGEPGVAAIEKGDPLAYLDQATALAQAVGAAPGGGEDGATAEAVDVIGREEIGGYDVSRLSAADPRALEAWLADNGYQPPPGSEPIFAEYVEEGWSYVAIRLAESAEGALKPLRVTFPTEEFVYPMRLAQLGTVPVDLTVYVLADGERTVSELATAFDGPLSELDPQPPPELAELFAQGTYVSKLQALGADPSAFTSDLAIEPAPGAGPAVGAAGVSGGDADRGEGAPAIAVVALVLGCVLLIASIWHAFRPR